MQKRTLYQAEDFTADISVDEYMLRFRDEEKFLVFCRQCRNFGRSWACPPFDFDTAGLLRKYRFAHLMATKITPAVPALPFSRVQEFILPERLRIERTLLDMERKIGGLSFSYTGKCLYCSEHTCTRKQNLPCRHPDKMRPSLEAFGFDIGRTLSELFGIELLWGRDGLLPEYLVLVSGFLHNTADRTVF